MFGFKTQLALVAKCMNYRPEWSNVYRRVEISLNTHDAGRLTTRDIGVATATNQAFSNVAAATG
ncbi:MAG: 4a-hydroxytetrahydrobiopterin dehydratase [Burkholderiales bacterium]